METTVSSEDAISMMHVHSGMLDLLDKEKTNGQTAIDYSKLIVELKSRLEDFCLYKNSDPKIVKVIKKYLDTEDMSGYE
jgi:hypothetical protein